MNEVRRRLVDEFDAICEETLAEVSSLRPDLARRIPAHVLVGAVRGTHRRAIDLLSEPETQALRDEAVEFGRQAARFGVGPEDVMAGYRIGAEIANGRVRSLLLERGAPAATVLALWSWSARFFDELADRTVEGVQREAAARHGRQARARQALADALLDGGVLPTGADAAWPIPQRLAVVVARGGDLEPPQHHGIVARRDGVLVALVDAQSPWLDAPHALVAVGPVVDGATVPESWAAARRLAALAGGQDGPLSEVPAVRADDHVVDLVLLGDAWARRTLPTRALAPLDTAQPRSRPLLEETLRAWLADPARPQAVANALQLHPQTVQYRLRRLRSVFGPALDDPEQRLALALALRLRDGPTSGAR